MPALFTRSTGRSSSDRGDHRLLRRHVHRVAGDVARERLETLQVEPVDLGALGDQALADRQPDPAGGADDGDTPSLEAVGHARLPV
jgi:hypothetical protein